MLYTCTIRQWLREPALFGGPGEPVAGVAYTVAIDVAEIPASLTLRFRGRPTLPQLRDAIADEIRALDRAPTAVAFTVDA